VSHEEKHSVETTDDPRIPEIQPWLKVMACAALPLVAAAFLPPSVRIPLAAVSVGLFVVGLVMLLREGLFD
jgi:hypothetical protein